MAAIAAMILEKNPDLNQVDIENTLKDTAVQIPARAEADPMTVFDLYNWTSGEFCPGFYGYSWGDDATGSGVVQADAVLEVSSSE